MLTTIALLTAAAMPQSPPQTAGDPLLHADLMPPNAICVIELAPLASFRNELEQTSFWTTLQEALDQPACRDLLAVLRAPLASEDGDGLRPSDLITNGFSLAIVPRQDGTGIGLTAVLEAGPLATRLSASLDERSADPKSGVERKDRAETPCWILTKGPQPLAIALAGTTMIFGSPPDQIDAVLQRRGGNAAKSLATEPRFREFVDHVGDQGRGDRVATVYLDLGAMLSTVLAAAPAATRQGMDPWLTRLGLDRLGAAGLIVSASDGKVRERFLVDLPRPRPPLLTALLPDAGQIGLDVATLAPRDIASFSAVQTNLRVIYIELMKALDAAEPRAASEVRRSIRMLGEQFGLDIESDIIFSLGERIVSLQWPASDSAMGGDWLVLVDLQRTDRVTEALQRVPGFDGGKLGAYDLLAKRGGGIGLAVGHGQLVVADSERTLRRWLGDQRVPTPHPEVRANLAKLAEGGIGAGWMNLRPLMNDALRVMDIAGAAQGPIGAARRVMSRAASNLTPLNWNVYSLPQGFSLHFESGSGFLSEFATSAFVGFAEEAINNPSFAQFLDSTRSSEDARAVRVAQVLAATQIAQARYFETHSAYADIDTLIAENLVDSDLFEGERGAGTRAVGDSLFTVLQTGEGEKDKHWAAIAWPAERRTGEVYGVTDKHGPMRNELIARSRGLGAPMLRDVFNRGDVAAGLTPGWRALDLGATDTELGPVVAGSGEAATIGIIAALERRGPKSADDILRYLDSDSPRVVSRAVYALGKLRVTTAIPRLIEIATRHPNIDVRQQTMRALLQSGDPRTVQASIQLLGDADHTVRKLAAANLGRLKAASASDALVALVSKASANPADDDAAGAALLALGEIGDPGVLLRAAGSHKGVGKKSEEALVWMFQTLSPSMGPADEPQSLMAVLDHPSGLLRRYAIQRLGELRDPSTAAALESRLTQEGDQLRPLVEVSLAAVRGSAVGANESGFAAAARRSFETARETLAGYWADPKIRGVAIAGFAGFLVMGIGLTIVLRKQRRRRQGETWAAKAREGAGPQPPRSRARLRPRYEDYEPDYSPTEEWDAEIASNADDDWATEEEEAEWDESTETTWQGHDESPAR